MNATTRMVIVIVSLFIDFVYKNVQSDVKSIV